MDGLITILPGDLIALDSFVNDYPLKVDLVYARADHPENVFGTAIYRHDARMWAHREMVPVILTAAEICYRHSGFIFELKDCLRTVEAQSLMLETDIVKRHPQWLEEPERLLSPPGKGGHPRGMAVDIILVDKNGDKLDMGTPFDYLTPNPAHNPAARAYRDFPAAIIENRMILESAMLQAARETNTPVLPLPQEWWDFRFMPATSNAYAPISDRDLPADMRMTSLVD